MLQFNTYYRIWLNKWKWPNKLSHMSAKILTPVVVFTVSWLVNLAVDVAFCSFMLGLSLGWVWMQRLHYSPLHATSKEWVSKGCEKQHHGETGKEPGIPEACKGRDIGSGAGQKPSPLAPCTCSMFSSCWVFLPLKDIVSIPRTISCAFLPSHLLWKQTTCNLSAWVLCLICWL